MYSILLKGFTVSGGLIMAIGAQNAFVIKQGLTRRHLFVTALLCSLIDAVLIFSGILGFGELISSYPVFLVISKYFAVAFLTVYGFISLKSAFKAKSLRAAEEEFLPSIKKTVLIILALSLLNPHVYIDTVVLLGSIASQHAEEEKIFFALGAISASFAWFFSITYGSRFLAPLLQHPNSWRVIDTLVAATMWVIAVGLLVAL